MTASSTTAGQRGVLRGRLLAASLVALKLAWKKFFALLAASREHPECVILAARAKRSE